MSKPGNDNDANSERRQERLARHCVKSFPARCGVQVGYLLPRYLQSRYITWQIFVGKILVEKIFCDAEILQIFVKQIFVWSRYLCGSRYLCVEQILFETAGNVPVATMRARTHRGPDATQRQRKQCPCLRAETWREREKQNEMRGREKNHLFETRSLTNI